MFHYSCKFRMSDQEQGVPPTVPEGLIQLKNPPDVTVEESKPLVDFGVIGDMMAKFEARNKKLIIDFIRISFLESFKAIIHVTLNYQKIVILIMLLINKGSTSQ